jgi:hypothetical protein
VRVAGNSAIGDDRVGDCVGDRVSGVVNGYGYSVGVRKAQVGPEALTSR